MTTGVHLSFSFPAPAKRLSSNDRLHWRCGAELTRLWREAGHVYACQTIRNGGFARRRLPHPSNIKITFEVPDPWRRRDPMNTYPTVKAIVDGIVTDAGLLPDDNADWVTIIQPEFVKGRDRVRVDVWPRDGAK